MQRLALVLALATLALSAAPSRSDAGSAKGTLTHPRATLELKYASLVKGPDALCTDGEVSEGMTVAQGRRRLRGAPGPRAEAGALA